MLKCIAELGVAFQHYDFFLQFSKKYFWKKMFNFFTLIKNDFQFYFRKEGGNIFFQFSLPKMFFGKLNLKKKKNQNL